MRTLALFFIYCIQFYKNFISPFLSQSCRYYPTCSSYALILLKFDNVFCALLKIIIRICSCNPLFKGGFAPAYIYLAPKKIENLKRHYQTYFFSQLTPQKIEKTIYFFIKSDSYLLKLQKCYIISISIEFNQEKGE